MASVEVKSGPTYMKQSKDRNSPGPTSFSKYVNFIFAILYYAKMTEQKSP